MTSMCRGPIRITKSAFLPRNRNRAKPYATRVDDRTAPIVESSAMRNVFRSRRGKFSWFHAVVKFSTSGAKVQACWSVRHRPTHSILVALGSFGSMNTLDSRPGSTRMSWRVDPSGIGTE